MCTFLLHNENRFLVLMSLTPVGAYVFDYSADCDRSKQQKYVGLSWHIWARLGIQLLHISFIGTKASVVIKLFHLKIALLGGL